MIFLFFDVFFSVCFEFLCALCFFNVFYCDFCNGNFGFSMIIFCFFSCFERFFGNVCLLFCFLTCIKSKNVVVFCFCLFFLIFSKYMWF